MKFVRRISAFIVMSMIFSLFTMPLAVNMELQESEEIEDTAVEYIEKLTRNSFLYENNDTESLTAKSVFQMASSTLSNTSSNSVQKFSFGNETISSKDIINNISVVEDIAQYNQYSRKKAGITREDFHAQYVCNNVNHTGNTATVHIGETLTFKYTDDPLNTEPSYMCNEYDVKLIKNDGKWYVADVTDEFAFSEASKASGFNLTKAIAEFDNSLIETHRIKANAVNSMPSKEYNTYLEDTENIEQNHIMTEEEIEEWEASPALEVTDNNSNISTSSTPIATASMTTRYILPQTATAKQYAWTYWWDDIDSGNGKWVGVNKDKWRNTTVFGDYGNSGGNCSNYTSQLVWAGLGGSNTVSSVSNIERPLTSSWKKGSSSFVSCTNFVNYTSSIRNNAASSGVMTNHYDLNKSSSLTQLSNYSSILPGSVFHVYNGGTGNQKSHAIYCLSVSGSSWGDVYYAANSSSAYNVKVTDGGFWSRTTVVGVEQPTAYRVVSNCSGHTFTSANDFTCNKCGFIRAVAFQRAPSNHMGIVKGNTRTVGGTVYQLATSASAGAMSTIPCYRIAMCVTSPSGKSTWYSRDNTTFLTQSVNFNEEGIWKIQFDARDRAETGTDSNKISYTFTIRVANYSALASGDEYGGVYDY